MKKINSLAILLALPFILVSLGLTAKDFKGIITYKVSITGSGVTDEVKAMMPKTMVLMIKDEKSRSEMVMGMGKTIVLTDAGTETSTVLLDMMGQKMAIQSTKEDIQKELDESPEYSVEKTSDTKQILDYTCKKAIIKSDDGMEITVYYTDELGTGSTYFDDPQFRQIDGLMLEFEIPNEGMTMKFTAISVEKKNVSDSEFEIPEGYEVKSKEEMQGMFGF
jgi:GLPGLI family protein